MCRYVRPAVADSRTFGAHVRGGQRVSGVARSVGGRGCSGARPSGERFLERATAVVLLPVPSSIHVWPVGVAASVVARRSSSAARSVGAAFSGARVAPRV